MKKYALNRRNFLRSSAVLLAGTLVAACAPKPAPTAVPEPPKVEATKAEPTKVEPTKVEPTQTPLPPEATAQPTAPQAPAAQDESNRNLEQIVKLSDSKVTVRGWHIPLYVVTDSKTYNDLLFDKKMEELTNVRVNWETSENIQLVMASGNLPDLLSAYLGSTQEWASYGMKGALAPLNDMIQAHPYLSTRMRKDPRIKASCTSPDGKIYFYPRVFEGLTGTWAGFVIRQDWLDEVKMPVPETMDQWYETLKAFKKQDPKRFPVSSDPYWMIWQWGVGSAGSNSPTDFYHEGDKVKYGPIEPAYHEALVFMNKLFTEGLLDPEYPQMGWTTDKLNQRIVGGICGSLFLDAGSIDNIGKIDAKVSAALLPARPPKGPLGNSENLMNYDIVDRNDGTAIAAASKYVDLLGKYMDLFYSDSGGTLMNWGVYGNTYTEEGGKKKFAEKVLTDKRMGPQEYLWNLVSPYWIGAMVVPADTLAGFTKPYQNAIQVWGKSPQQSIQLPPLFFADDEQQILNKVMTDLGTLVEENRAAFVRGEKNLDSDYTSMVGTIKSMGIADALKVYQAAYDRYLAAMKS